MKVAFFSNFLNHHQTPFCEEMVKRLGKDFVFVSTQELPQDRREMGYHDLSVKSYELNAYEDEKKEQLALNIADNADVVIIGSAPTSFIEKRLEKDLLTFRYTERYFKQGKWRILDPRVFLSLYKNDIKYKKNKNFLLLCASAYTAPDCAFIGCYKNKAYKWGYFPEVKKYEDVNSLIGNKKKNSILWVSRLIKLKRPEHVLYVAKRLKKEGYDFTLDMIGIGEEENNIRKAIEKNNLEDCVRLLGAMSPEEVRRHMEESEIFLFTSNKNEGWGAVLNESMNSACAVVASRDIGSVPYLIKDGENGFTYRKDNELYDKVKYLLENKTERKNLGRKAYETMVGEWNAETAADRLLKLIDNIKNGKDSEYTSGPCSKG